MKNKKIINIFNYLTILIFILNTNCTMNSSQSSEKTQPPENPPSSESYLIYNNISTRNDMPFSVAVNDNFLFIAGIDDTQGNWQWHIEKRELGLGQLVDDFGTNGIIISNPSTEDDYPTKILIDSNYIYISGVEKSPLDSKDYIWRLEKYNISTGTLDSNFGSSGILSLNISAKKRLFK